MSENSLSRRGGGDTKELTDSLSKCLVINNPTPTPQSLLQFTRGSTIFQVTTKQIAFMLGDSFRMYGTVFCVKFRFTITEQSMSSNIISYFSVRTSLTFYQQSSSCLNNTNLLKWRLLMLKIYCSLMLILSFFNEYVPSLDLLTGNQLNTSVLNG